MAVFGGWVVFGGMGNTKTFMRGLVLFGFGAAALLPAQEKVYSFSTLAGAASAGHLRA